MNRILVVAALVMVLTGCGDTSPFGNQRYQIVKGTHQDYLLDTKTGRTWRYADSGNVYGENPSWNILPVQDETDATIEKVIESINMEEYITEAEKEAQRQRGLQEQSN